MPNTRRSASSCSRLRRPRREGTAGRGRRRGRGGRLLPHRPLAEPPVRPLDDLHVGEAGGRAGRRWRSTDSASARSRPGGSTTSQPVRADPPTRAQDTSQLGVRRRRASANWIASTTITASTEPSSSPVASRPPDPEVRVAPEPGGLLGGLAHRDRAEVDADQPGAGALRDLEPVAAAPAGQVEQHLALGEAQRVRDVGDAVPGQQAGGLEVRGQAEVPLLDLVLARGVLHVGVPLVEVRHRVGAVAHPPSIAGWLRLAGRTPVRRPLLHLRTLLVDADAGAAATAGLPVAPEDPGGPPAARVTGQGLLDALLVGVEGRAGAAYESREVGHLADRQPRVHPGQEAQLALVEVAEPGQVALVEDRVGDRAGRVGEQPPQRLVLVPVGSEQVGAEVTDDGVLGVAGDHLDDAEREADGGPVLGAQHDPGLVGGAAPAGARLVEVPGALHLEVRVQGVAVPGRSG